MTTSQIPAVSAKTGPTGQQVRPDRPTRAFRWAYLIPAVVLVGLWALAPAAYTLWRSFFGDEFVAPTFSGLAGYGQVLTDPAIIKSMINTVIWLIGTVIIPGGLGLAIASLTESVSWGKWPRLLIVLPYALSGTAVAVVWNFMLQENGAINDLLINVGLGGLTHAWLLSWPLNTIVMVLANSWQASGVAVILYLVGLQGIPQETIEAAALDGVAGVKRFFLIIFPQLRNTTAIVLGISLANGLKSFDFIWVLTQGGPGRSTETLALSMYWQSFVLQRPGTGAAITVILSILVVAVSVGYLQRQLKEQ
ncbi:carbohydrate ABC transporter permease [Acidipropionibacterium virtanenii]|uniref:Lactose transport system permease protein LacF n=1 Tax=Acidipropionibacterium virtanenii TaxID=2057246 RepID=A0A344UQK0_9ACTN|nr:sugar ABC transporter permease [Acidipropionibacterium virtanenii]AXE37548.1 Lactose transport system permease protein LacF [Acidipropionibacterium virtanenii]